MANAKKQLVERRAALAAAAATILGALLPGCESSPALGPPCHLRPNDLFTRCTCPGYVRGRWFHGVHLCANCDHNEDAHHW